MVERVFAGCLVTGIGLGAVGVLLLTHLGHAHQHLAHVHRLFHLRLPVHVRWPFHLHHGAVQALAAAPDVAQFAGATPTLQVAPSWMLPLVVSGCLMAFGAGGLAARTGLHTSVWGAVVLALLIALAFVAFLVLVLGRTLSASEAAGQSSGSSLLGVAGRVSVAIPAGEVGAVAYLREGKRSTMPARARHGQALAQGTPVLIVDIENHIAQVEPY